MPIMNGIDVIKNIVNSDISKKPSFVLVTGDTGGIFRQAYDLGVFRIISKMSSQSELKYTIEEFLSLQNVRQDEHDNVHQKKHFKLFGNRKHKIFFACKFTKTGQIEYTKKVVELCRETIEQI